MRPGKVVPSQSLCTLTPRLMMPYLPRDRYGPRPNSRVTSRQIESGRFSSASRAKKRQTFGQETMTFLTDPVATCQLQEHLAIEPARGAIIDILDRSLVAQLGGLGAALEAFLLAQRAFALEQNAEPLRMA
jgi:hypothetical protein